LAWRGCQRVGQDRLRNGRERLAKNFGRHLPEGQEPPGAEVADACATCAERLLAEKKLQLVDELYLELSGQGEPDQVRMASAAWQFLDGFPMGRKSVYAKPSKARTQRGRIWPYCLCPKSKRPTLRSSSHELSVRSQPPVQALLVGALALRRDAAARGAVLAAASNKKEAVRLAALRAWDVRGRVGGENALGPDRRPARQRRKARPLAAASCDCAARVNETLARMIPERDARDRAELIPYPCGPKRRKRKARSEEVCRGPGCDGPQGVVEGAGSLARAEDVASLVDLLIRAKEDARDDAERAVAMVLKRPDRAGARVVIEKLDAAEAPGAQAALVRIASAVGDDGALPAMRKAVQSPDAGVRDAGRPRAGRVADARPVRGPRKPGAPRPAAGPSHHGPSRRHSAFGQGQRAHARTNDRPDRRVDPACRPDRRAEGDARGVWDGVRRSAHFAWPSGTSTIRSLAPRPASP